MIKANPEPVKGPTLERPIPLITAGGMTLEQVEEAALAIDRTPIIPVLLDAADRAGLAWDEVPTDIDYDEDFEDDLADEYESPAPEPYDSPAYDDEGFDDPDW